MSFDARSLERLQQLGRSLPQPLPKPETTAAPAPPATAKRHRVETETDPQALFHELMQVSPDGTVPPHLMDRLRQAEANAAAANAAVANAPRAQQPLSQRQRRGRPQQPTGPRRPPASSEELELYSAFQDLLHLESDDLEDLDTRGSSRRPQG